MTAEFIDLKGTMTAARRPSAGSMAPSEKPYLKTGVFSLARHRIVWLLVLMISGMITGGILGRYEAAIAAMPLLVTFIPMLTDTGGNAGRAFPMGDSFAHQAVEGILAHGGDDLVHLCLVVLLQVDRHPVVQSHRVRPEWSAMTTAVLIMCSR